MIHENLEESKNSKQVNDEVLRFEKMLSNNDSLYFDIAEFEKIIRFYITNNQIQEAKEVCKYALKLHPDSFAIQLKKAQILIESKKLEEAKKILTKMLLIEPTNIEILLLMGVANAKTDNIDEAVAQFELALKNFSFDKHLDEILHDIALVFIRVEQFSVALNFLERAHKDNEKNNSVIYDIAFCLEKIDKNEESVKFFVKYLEEDPFSKLTWYNLGVVYKKLNLLDKAIEAYDYASAIDDKFASPIFNKANIFYKQHKLIDAIKTFFDLLELEPYDPSIYCYIAECYEGLDNFKESLKYYKKTLKIDITYAEAWYGLGLLMVFKEKFNLSISYFRKATKYDSENPMYWYTLATILNGLNKYEESELAYKKTITFNPFNVDFWLGYSELKFHNKEEEKAIELLENAKNYNPNNALINYRLAAYLFNIGKKTTAFKYLNNALQQDYSLHKDFFNFYPKAKINKSIKKLIDSFIL